MRVDTIKTASLEYTDGLSDDAVQIRKLDWFDAISLDPSVQGIFKLQLESLGAQVIVGADIVEHFVCGVSQSRQA